MIKVAKTLVLGVALFSSLVASASKKLNVKMEEGNSALVVSLEGVVSGETLALVDSKGETLYSEVLSEVEEFSKSFNIKDLKQGVYTIKSITENTIKITPFIVVPQMNKVVKGESEIFIKPTITSEGDDLIVEVDNFHNKKVGIFIYELNDTRTVGEVENLTGLTVVKRFNKALISKTEFNVVVTIGSESFEQKVSF